MEGAMRECLAQGAWCDVRLACGGREFRAHRVVLSSVSPFLRVLLQSRPDEDIPTTIVMPEVEEEAMSAVLHYIYNGEVSVPTHLLEAFFTIVKTLQICVDKKALIRFREKIEDFDTKILDVEVFKKAITTRLMPALKNLNEKGVSITTSKNTAGVVENKQLDLEHVLKGDRICKSVSPYRTEVGYRLRPEVCLISQSEKRQRQESTTVARVLDPVRDRRRVSPERDSPPHHRRRRPPAPRLRRGNGPATTCVATITNDDNLERKSSPVTNETLLGWQTTSPADSPEILSSASSTCRPLHQTDSDTGTSEPRKRPKYTKNCVPNITFRNDHRVPAGNATNFDPTERLHAVDNWRDGNIIDPRNSLSAGADSVRKPAVLRPVPTLLPIAPMYNLPPPPLAPMAEHGGYFRPPPDLLDLSSAHLARLNLLRSSSSDETRMTLLSTHLNGYAVARSLQSNPFNSTYPSRLYTTNKDPIRLSDSYAEGERMMEVELDRTRMRRAAYNKVLASPWCPRLPPTYRPPPALPPPQRCVQSTLPHPLQLHPPSTDSEMTEQLSASGSLVVDECDEKLSSNDDNNNVREVSSSPAPVPSPPPAPLAPESTLAAAAAAVIPHSIDVIIGKESGGGQTMRCATCDKVFTCRGTLAAHVRAHAAAAAGGARHTCAECGKSFSQLRNYKYHVSVHRGTREFAATCNVCGKYFNDRGYLSSHMKIHRNRKEYECPHCPKSFNQRVAYNMHVRIHTGVKPHVCAECGKAFSRKMLLKQHQRTHSGERPYACSVCDKRFADRSNMTLHMRLHSGVKPFSCSLCPKSFTKKHHLKTHLNYHTGDKPYSCPRCLLAFSQSSNMRTHLKKCNATPGGDTDVISPVVTPT